MKVNTPLLHFRRPSPGYYTWCVSFGSLLVALKGFVDDIRIYSYALNADEVKMLYEGKEPPREKASDD